MLNLSKRMKIFGTSCILVSMLFLCTTWVKASERVDYDFSDYQEDVIGALREMEGFAAWFGASIDLSGIEKLIDVLIDGKLTAVEMTTVCKEGSALLKGAEELFTPSGKDKEMLDNFYVFCYVYRLIFVATVISGLLTILSYFKEKFKNAEYIFLSFLRRNLKTLNIYF